MDRPALRGTLIAAGYIANIGSAASPNSIILTDNVNNQWGAWNNPEYYFVAGEVAPEPSMFLVCGIGFGSRSSCVCGVVLQKPGDMR